MSRDVFGNVHRGYRQSPYAGAASAGVGALSAGAQWLRSQTITVPNTVAHYGANVARWMYPDLFRDIDTRADQLIAANAVGVRPTFLTGMPLNKRKRTSANSTAFKRVRASYTTARRIMGRMGPSRFHGAELISA